MKTSSPLHIRLAAVVLGWCAFMLNAGAQVPGLLNYQGKVSIGTTPFTGTGQFKFALVNATGTATFWSNDGSSTEGAAPTAAVSLPVVNGLYFVQLGDTTLANMVTLPHAVFQNADVRLRVWFNDGAHGFEQITPDQRIAAVGYAMMAGAVQDGAITSSMIAAGAVGSDQLAAGAVQSSNIVNGAVGSAQMAADSVQAGNIAPGAVGTTQLADQAVTSAKLSTNAVQASHISAGAVGTNQLGNEAVTSAKLAPNAVQSANIAAGAVGTSQLGAGAVQSANLATGAVQSSNIADGAVGSVQMAAGAVQASNIAAGAVGSSQLADFAVNTSKLNLGMEEGTAAGGTMTASAGTLTLTRSFVLSYQKPPNVTFLTAGWTLGTVTATSFTATTPFTPVTADGAGNVGLEGSMAIVGGRPAVSYYDAPNGDLKYIRANDASGQTWPAPVTVDGGGDIVGFSSSLAVVNGNPAITYYDADGQNLKYVRATNADGTAWGTQVVIDSAGDVGWFTSLAVVNGRPAVCYYDKTNGRVKYARASDTTGAAWAAPVVVDNVGTGLGTRMSMQVVSGKPAIAYFDQAAGDLRYARANDTDGAAGQWGTPVVIDAAGSVGVAPSLAIVDGNPAISYFDSTNDALKYVRAADATGVAWGASLTLDSSGDAGVYNSLAVINGTPAIAYFAQTSSDLRFIRSKDAQGAAWGPPFVVDSADAVGRHTSMVPLNGGAAISYYDNTNLDLKFALVPDLRWRASDGSTVMLTAAAVADGAVGSAQLAAGAVQSANIATGAVQSTNIATGAVGSAQIATGAVQGTNIAPGAVGSNQLAKPPQSGQVTAAELDFDFTSARFAVTFPQVTATTPIVALALAPSTASFPESADVRILSTSTTGFTGKLTDMPVRKSLVDSLGREGSSLTVDGNPAIAYREGFDISPSVLRFARNSASDGSGTWELELVDSNATDSMGIEISMAIASGNPAIAYTTSAGALKFARNTNASGSGTWAVQTVIASNVGHCSLAVISGTPAIAFYDSTAGNLRYARNAIADGSGTWSVFTVDTGGTDDVGNDCALMLVNNRPAISYNNGTDGHLQFVRSTNTTGTAWGVPVTVDSVGSNSVMADAGGFPVIAYRSSGLDIKFARNGSTDGTGPWTVSTIASNPGGPSLFASSFDMKIIHGTPAIVYYAGDDIMYMRALDALGSNWDGSSNLVNVYNSNLHTRGSFTSLHTVLGAPAVFYLDDFDDADDLKWLAPTLPAGGQVNWIAIEP